MKKNRETLKSMSERGREEALPQGVGIQGRNNVHKLIISRRVSRPNSLGIDPRSWFPADVMKKVDGRADNTTKVLV
jgi:hypothetical protein